MRKIVFTWLILSSPVYVSIQAQTVLYRYNEQGSCTFRIYVDEAQKARSHQKLADEKTLIKVAVEPSTIFEDQITVSPMGIPQNSNLSYL